MSGFSILISTWNNLNYLKASIDSLRKYSNLDNEICVYSDGSTDGTLEWLEEQEDLRWHYSHKWKGSLTGRNRAAELATKEYVFLSEDAFIYSSNWDKNYMSWVKKLPDTFISPQLIQPEDKNYGCPDCGNSIETFDEAIFINLVNKVSEDRIDFTYSWGLPVMKRDLFLELGGHDTAFDPLSFGVLDLKLRTKEKIPNLRFARAFNVLLYHFPSMSWKHLKGTKYWKKKHQEHRDHFFKKWNMDISEAYKYLLTEAV